MFLGLGERFLPVAMDMFIYFYTFTFKSVSVSLSKKIDWEFLWVEIKRPTFSCMFRPLWKSHHGEGQKKENQVDQRGQNDSLHCKIELYDFSKKLLKGIVQLLLFEQASPASYLT